MKIVLVIDQYDEHGNGASVSTQRFARALKKLGHRVRILSTGPPAPDKYTVGKRRIPVVSMVAARQGICFGRPEKKVLQEALQWADIVHFQLPFKLEKRGMKMARQMGVPMVTSFHLQPDNITYNIGLGRFEWLSSLIYHYFRIAFYSHFTHIHCPSRFIADQLIRHGYKSKLHVISNGVTENFVPYPVDKPPAWQDKVVIIMVGRYAAEKRQDVLMEAVRHSRYSKDIQLIFAGKGPEEARYRRMAAGLINPPIFEFYPQPELIKLLNTCDLYVHTSDVEIEAISCVEAFSCGLVPIIADSKRSATSQFALTDKNLFKAGDALSLAQRIDYWIEHPQERAMLSKRYAQWAENFRMDRIMEQTLAMYMEAIKHRDWYMSTPPPDKTDEHVIKLSPSHKLNIDETFNFVPESLLFRLFSRLVYLILLPLLSVFNWAVLGVRIQGRENLHSIKEGVVTVSNHIHILDCAMVGMCYFPKMCHFTSVQNIFETPVVRRLVRMLGGIPIPDSIRMLKPFSQAISRCLAQSKAVHFYPETALWPYYNHLRPFKAGAFHMAADNNVPVVPIVLTCRRPTGPYLLWRIKPLISVQVLEPVYPDMDLDKWNRRNKLRDTVFRRMDAVIKGGESRYMENEPVQREQSRQYGT
jgi:1,2-diacylglycerol 3-alpha-glucosyltransferase